MNKQLAVAGLVAALVAGYHNSSRAASVTFAQVQNLSSIQLTALPGSSPGNSYTGSTISYGSANPVNFFFQNPDGSVRTKQATPFGPTDLIQATFNLSATTGFPPSTVDGQAQNPPPNTNIFQSFNTVTVTIKSSKNQTVDGVFIPAGSNLLSFTSGSASSGTGSAAIGGTLSAGDAATASYDSSTGTPNAVTYDPSNGSGSTTATFAGSDRLAPPFRKNFVMFSSDFLNFNNATSDGFSFALSNVIDSNNPSFNYTLVQDDNLTGPSYIDSFLSQGVGTFNSQFSVPEPGSIALMIGMGISGSAFFLRQRRRAK
jgi:hypothetical protein